MTSRLHSALLLLCVLSVPVWSVWDWWPVVGAESYPSEGRISAVQDMSAGGERETRLPVRWIHFDSPFEPKGEGPAFPVLKPASWGEWPHASTQDSLWLRPVAAVAGENEAMDTALASEPVGQPGSADDPTPPATATRESSDRSGNHGVDNLGNRDSGDSVRGLADIPGNPPVAGVATWYHDSLAGGTMANGEPYNPWDPTIAASMDYPLGTRLRVEYRKVITVTVSDRGLLGRGHLDLSRAAFVELVGSTDAGVIPVTVEVQNE